ncbi:hypothetical protein KAR91_14305 [Candidatus Pacearchaeota archaeon]|nr:hypothetical protein [Candidatus Pacearchaeota archaeon]
MKEFKDLKVGDCFKANGIYLVKITDTAAVVIEVMHTVDPDQKVEPFEPVIK